MVSACIDVRCYICSLSNCLISCNEIHHRVFLPGMCNYNDAVGSSLRYVPQIKDHVLTWIHHHWWTFLLRLFLQCQKLKHALDRWQSLSWLGSSFTNSVEPSCYHEINLIYLSDTHTLQKMHLNVWRGLWGFCVDNWWTVEKLLPVLAKVIYPNIEW